MKTPFIPDNEFTMDQLVEQILADESVPKAKRATFASAANQLAKCLGPLKVCHCLVSLGVLNDGTKEAFRRRRFEAVAGD